MRLLCYALFLVTSLLVGCTSSDNKAAELLDTARFEEKQNNLEHAAKLYDEILKSYPASSAAKDAGARLSVIRPQKR